MKDKFIEFLKENNAYDAFCNSFIKVRGIKAEQIEWRIGYFVEVLDPQGLIESAFLWHLTKEGKGFWERLNDKWKEKLNEL